jgi:hypothetical protein
MTTNSQAMLTQAGSKDSFHKIKAEIKELLTWMNSLNSDVTSEDIRKRRAVWNLLEDELAFLYCTAEEICREGKTPAEEYENWLSPITGAQDDD